MHPELIETMLVDAAGSIPLLSRHLARLEASCAALDYQWDGAPDIEQELYTVVASLTAPGAHRLRLLLSRTGQRTISTAPMLPLPDTQYVMLSGDALNADELLLRYKTTYRPWYSNATQWLTEHPEVFDLLYLNQQGELCEGSRSNVYLQRHGVWYTPPIENGCLPGVQRAALLESGQVKERVLTLDDLHQADSIRLSNALRGWFDVVLRTA